jgi:hypothetical protein
MSGKEEGNRPTEKEIQTVGPSYGNKVKLPDTEARTATSFRQVQCSNSCSEIVYYPSRELLVITDDREIKNHHSSQHRERYRNRFEFRGMPKKNTW